VGRYTGPVGKISRNLKVNLAETPKIDALMKRRPNPSGQHGAARKKESEFGQQLKEKQRLKLRYGLREQQLRRYYEMASRKKGNTGTILLQTLERRLDNLLFRAGFAATRRQARQLCAHGHVVVNGQRVTVASILLREGDIVTVREQSRPFLSLLVEVNAGNANALDCSWLTVSKETLSVRLDRLPQREELDASTREQLIIEYYSR
jgi:small subunit ribosomal protein S4